MTAPEAADSDDPERSPEVIELREQINEMTRLIATYPASLEFRNSLRSLEKQLQTTLQGFTLLNFVKATAEEIVHHPQARQLAFWFALDQQAREVIYDKLVQQVRVQDGNVTSVVLKV